MVSTGKGLDLARALYEEVLGPALIFPHTGCLVGEGSEILGFDTDRSADHEWGPRLQIFVAADFLDPARDLIDKALPATFRGLPTRWFSLAAGRVAHHIEVDTVEHWLCQHLPTLPADPTSRHGWPPRNSICYNSPPAKCSTTTLVNSPDGGRPTSGIRWICGGG